MLADSPVIAYAVKQSNGAASRPSATSTTPRRTAIVVPKDDDRVRATPSLDALKTIIADGTYTEVARQVGRQRRRDHRLRRSTAPVR